MKYLQTYENVKPNYKIGDYVLLKEDDDTNAKRGNNWTNLIRIIIIKDYIIIRRHPEKVRYTCTAFDEDLNIVEPKRFFLEDNILRKLTTKEKENFIIKQTANKYNL